MEDLMQSMWDSESRNSPYSTVADIEDETCECCGHLLGTNPGDCQDCEMAAEYEAGV